MTPQELDHAMGAHARFEVTHRGRTQWLQPVLPDEGKYHCVLSTPTSSTVAFLDLADMGAYERAGDLVLVDPLTFELDGARVVAARDGHNCVAMAVSLLALFELPALFTYTKPKHVAEDRSVRLGWAGGETFGGRDYDRGMAKRSYRLDRTLSVRLAPNATSRPVWTGEGYLRGLL